MNFLALDGTPWERGQIYGETCKSIILENIERWKHRISVVHTQTNLDKYIQKLVKETNFLGAVKKWAPQLLEEVKGIGDGAGIDFNTIFAFQLLDEEWWYRRFERAFIRQTTEQCSSLGRFKESDNPGLLAQNMDLPSHYDGFQVLLHMKYPESSLESFVFTTAGMIALCGLNNRPVGVCVNTLGDLNYSTEGLPVSFIVRSILEQPSLEKAIEFIHQIKHASGENYMIGGTEKLVSFECSANKVSQYVPSKKANRVYHTNHPLVNDDLIFPTPARDCSETSLPRFDYLENRLEDPSKSITVDIIKYILSSHEGPVCVHDNYQSGGWVTLGSLIYVLSTPPELHIASGPPCFKEWKNFKF